MMMDSLWVPDFLVTRPVSSNSDKDKETRIVQLSLEECVGLEDEIFWFGHLIMNSAPEIQERIGFAYFPCFVYGYMGLLLKRKLLDVEKLAKFFRTQLYLFLYKELVEILLNLESWERVCDHPYFGNFCHNNFEMKLSDEDKEYLITVLKGLKCPHVCFILDFNLGIKVNPPSYLAQIYADLNAIRERVANEPTSKGIGNRGTSAITTGSGITNQGIIDDPGHSKRPYLAYHVQSVINTGDERLTCADILKDGTRFAIGLSDSDVQCYKFEIRPPRKDERLTKNWGYRINDSDYYPPRLSNTFQGHLQQINGVEFADSDLLLSCSEDTTVRAWRLSRNTCVGVYKDHTRAVLRVTANSNSFFLSCGADHLARLWDFSRTNATQVFEHYAAIKYIGLHPDSNIFATASADKRVQLWSIKDKEKIWTLRPYIKNATCFKFSPNGKYLACGDDEGYVSIFDIAARDLLYQTKAHRRSIFGLAFNIRGDVYATCSSQGAINLWDIQHTVLDRGNTVLARCDTVRFSNPVVRYCTNGQLLSVGSK